MILTTEQAADELDVTPGAVRMMVLRGDLSPIVRGARPMRFHLLDVLALGERRLTSRERARLDRLSRVLDMHASAM